MCGIAGLWSTGHDRPADVIGSMIAALRHRGPDSEGQWLADDGSLALGHTRLAIVDLSAQGRQPMVSPSGRYVIVFNGELYNHLEIRERLGDALPWRGHSDTETFLSAIEHWGIERALEAAVGMFAFGLWDRLAKKLILARDRLGEKPLHYAPVAGGLAFASEIKALLCCPGIDDSPDEDALKSYLHLGFIMAPRSAFRGIRKLPAGIMMTFDAPDRPGVATRYWQLPRPPEEAPSGARSSDAERLDTLERLLRTSVRQQMLADVPLGAFLSGGIDSSLIVTLMQQASNRPVRTFSMGFGEGQDDELAAASRTAQRLGTQHTELLVTPADVLATLPRMASIYDEPFADSSQVPTTLLSQLTRHHVTVALTGDAGDELFGGYNRYLLANLIQARFGQWSARSRHRLGDLLGALPANAVDRVAAAARGIGLRTVPVSLGEKTARIARFIRTDSAIEAYTSTLSQWIERVPVNGAGAALRLESLPGRSLPQQMMWWDLQTYLVDDILVKVDRAAMASSLETRVPMLDHRVVEFAVTLPLDMKIRDGRSKWPLRQLLHRLLPGLDFDRPKQGFSVPLDAWLRGPLRDWAESLLAAERLAELGWVDGPAVRQTWAEHLTGRRNHVRALWTVLMLQAWRDGSPGRRIADSSDATKLATSAT